VRPSFIQLGSGSEVRVSRVVRLNSHLAAADTIPTGWVAVGNPAQLLPPSGHERIWKIQKPLAFPLNVYGFERSEATMEKTTRRLSEAVGSHVSDELSVWEPVGFDGIEPNRIARDESHARSSPSPARMSLEKLRGSAAGRALVGR
jgi:hypothetical protein